MKKSIACFVVIFFILSNFDIHAQCDFLGAWKKNLTNNTQYKWNFEYSNPLPIIRGNNGDITDQEEMETYIYNSILWAFGKWTGILSGTGITFTPSSNNPDILFETRSTNDVGAMEANYQSHPQNIGINKDFIHHFKDLNSLGLPDIKANILHEIGHLVLGYYHVEDYELSSVMHEIPRVREFNLCDIERVISLYNPIKEVTVKNSYGAGPMKIDNASYFITIPASGKTINDWREFSFPHSFTAKDNQKPSGQTFYQKFENWTAPISGTNLNISVSVPYTTNPLYRANFSSEFNITFSNYHEGGEIGGKIWVDDDEYTSPTSGLHAYGANTIKGKAVSHSINDVWFKFIKWSGEQGGTSYEYNFS